MRSPSPHLWCLLLFHACCITAFSQTTLKRYDILISEIMSRPNTQSGLPNNKWLELHNVSSSPVNLQGWRLGDAGSLSGPMPSVVLKPDSFLIVCTGSAVTALQIYGRTISVTSFLTLRVDGDLIYLQAADGRTIHSLNYTGGWYQNEIKQTGGWSLEMIDPQSPCSGISNWKASIDPKGGTPGKKNSIYGKNTDNTAPALLSTYAIDNQTIVTVFDEPVDSLAGATATNYTIGGGLSAIQAVAIPPLFTSVRLKLNRPMQPHTIYNVTARNVRDCKGNIIGASNTAKTGLAEDAAPKDIVINEILSHARPNAYDYIEYYNASNKIFDASKLSIANRNSLGIISSIKPLSSVPFYIFPGDYVVATEDAVSLVVNYLVKNPDHVLTIASMPSTPNEAGVALILNAQGEVVDEVDYDSKWHYKLINSDVGIALERIDPAGLSQDATNWHSAASTSGYGTPTYRNSQYKEINSGGATIALTPAVFSPDNDGRDDITTIQYTMSDVRYIANVTIFNAIGRPVRYLAKNDILSLKGYWNWDGLDEKGVVLPAGPYIVLTEIFNLQGKKQQFKNVLVLAKALK